MSKISKSILKSAVLPASLMPLFHLNGLSSILGFHLEVQPFRNRAYVGLPPIWALSQTVFVQPKKNINNAVVGLH